jgi:uncharacterized protein YkwD
MKKILFILLLLLAGSSASHARNSLEGDVIDELNIARTKPRLYADFIKEYRRLYKGKYMYLSGSNVRIVTSEGVSAVDEAIRFLRKQKPLAPLDPSQALAEAAEDLVEDQGSSSETGHYGRLSGSMSRRIERHGQWQGSIGENISYGFKDPRWVVIQLIVDDGVRGRGHRGNIFNPAFRRAGAACGSHAGYGTMCVIDFAEGVNR